MDTTTFKIEVRVSKSHGLEVYKVFLNGCYVTEYLSRELAATKVMLLKNKLKAA